jgi:type 1 glutamine amidotransferase
MSPCTRYAALLAVGLLTFPAATGADEPRLKALIVDGQNNHAWQSTTPLLRGMLEETGLFQVEVFTSPPAGEDTSSFAPDWGAHDVVVSNYNGAPWSDTTQRALVEYVRKGGGLVVVHAANNAFPDWPEYNEMIGLGWRGAEFGDRITVDDAGELVRTVKGEGPGAGHGSQHPFQIVVRDGEHPVTDGMPRAWMHAADELYHGQRGPARNMRVLASAFSASETGGTGEREPIIWVIPYGDGRVFTTVMGHSPEAMQCVGFVATVQRGTEWAATGEVTRTQLPEDFPTAEEVKVRVQE